MEKVKRLSASPLIRHIAQSLQWVCVAGAVWFIGVFLYISLSSITYPYNLEWMEGQTIDIVQRLMQGKPFYSAPTINYVPYLYTPLYFYMGALFSEIFGVGFFSTRLLSIVSIVGSGFIMYAWIHKENGNWKAGIIGTGLFFGTYILSGRWFDNSRVDSLFMFMNMASLYVFSFYKTPRASVAAGVLATLAFFTKQVSLVIILPVFAAELFINRRHAVTALAVTGILVVGGVVIYDALSDGWFSFYVFTVPAGHVIDPRIIWGFWRFNMFYPLGLLMLITAVFLYMSWRDDWKNGMRYAAFTFSAITAAYIARLHLYGYFNVLMPAHLVLAFMTGLAFMQVARKDNQVLMVLLSIAVIWQMGILFYKPQHFIPTQKSVLVGDKFLQKLSEIPGDVFIPECQYIQTRVGKTSYTLGMAAFDIIRADLGKRRDVQKKFLFDLKQAIASNRFHAVIPGRLVPMPDFRLYFAAREKIDFPSEFVTGAINFMLPEVYIRNVVGSMEEPALPN